jgi:predicted metal-dependent HD superfamily phosphohydrolase
MISGAVRDELIARYGEPHRRYHTMIHVEDCLTQVRASTDLTADQRDLLETAIWFHDAIYDATRHDNEAESARLAVERLTTEGARRGSSTRSRA